MTYPLLWQHVKGPAAMPNLPQSWLADQVTAFALSLVVSFLLVRVAESLGGAAGFVVTGMALFGFLVSLFLALCVAFTIIGCLAFLSLSLA